MLPPPPVCFYVDLDLTLVASPVDSDNPTKYPTIDSVPTLIRPGAHPFLHQLRNSGFPVFLYTAASKAWARHQIRRYALQDLLAGVFYMGAKPKCVGLRNFLIDDQALTKQDIKEGNVTQSWATKSAPFFGTLFPIYVHPFEMDGFDRRPDLRDALAAIDEVHGRW